MKDIPSDVLWAWSVKIRGYGGTDTIDKCQAIIEKYPEHFPDEVKYKTIPEQVHKAYRDEMYPGWDEPIKIVDIGRGDGFMSEVEKGAAKGEFTTKSFKQAWEAYGKMLDKEHEEERRKERVWLKHYGKYGITYNKYYKLIPMKKTIAVVGNPFHIETPMERLVVNVIDDAEKQLQKEKELYVHEQTEGLTRKEREAVLVPIRTEPKIERNAPCPCGSGKKYKKCCIK